MYLDYKTVFDSEDTSSDATAPTLTLGTVTGTFVRGEKITGSSSGATARNYYNNKSNTICLNRWIWCNRLYNI